jgi:fatty-acyl-CoA synthase
VLISCPLIRLDRARHIISIRFFDWIAHHASRRADAIATVDLATQRQFTYRVLDQRISRLARFLQDGYGAGPGDRIALIAQNGTCVFELQFACFRLGAIFVPLNWRLAPPELASILADCTPRVLVHDKGFADLAGRLSGGSTSMQLCAIGAGALRCEEALTRGPVLGNSYPVLLNSTATILYTSGTTGLPKGVLVTHGMNVWNAINSTSTAQLTGSTVFLCLLPLFHTGGLNAFANPTFHAGGTVIVARTFDAGDCLRVLADRKYGITHMFGVPANFQFMAQHDDFADCDLSRLSLACVGGAPASEVMIGAWLSKGVALQHAYGMTETGPLMLFLDRSDAARKIGSAGKPILHGEVRVVGAEGADAESGEVGELWVRGPSITPGYWKQTDLTRLSFSDGWLRTGDAARKDTEGYYFIVDRWKDMFISGGENVYPAEVENVIYRLPEIAEVAVIGVPDAQWGEVGHAFVTLRPGTALVAEDVLMHCAKLLARFKLPKYVAFTDALPRNATGKVHKPTLRAQMSVLSLSASK